MTKLYSARYEDGDGEKEILFAAEEGANLEFVLGLLLREHMGEDVSFVNIGGHPIWPVHSVFNPYELKQYAVQLTCEK